MRETGRDTLRVHQFILVKSTEFCVIQSMDRQNKKQFVQLTCVKCQASFSKEKKEYDRQVKRKGNCNFFCNRQCAGFLQESKPGAHFQFILKACLASAKRKNLEFNLTKEYLKSLWEKQSGKCAYTGIQLEPPTHKYLQSPRKGSLDRIDSSKGYIKGNVEYVCVFVNLGKNGFSKESVQSILTESQNRVLV